MSIVPTAHETACRNLLASLIVYERSLREPELAEAVEYDAIQTGVSYEQALQRDAKSVLDGARLPDNADTTRAISVLQQFVASKTPETGALRDVAAAVQSVLDYELRCQEDADFHVWWSQFEQGIVVKRPIYSAKGRALTERLVSLLEKRFGEDSTSFIDPMFIARHAEDSDPDERLLFEEAIEQLEALRQKGEQPERDTHYGIYCECVRWECKIAVEHTTTSSAVDLEPRDTSTGHAGLPGEAIAGGRLADGPDSGLHYISACPVDGKGEGIYFWRIEGRDLAKRICRLLAKLRPSHLFTADPADRHDEDDRLIIEDGIEWYEYHADTTNWDFLGYAVPQEMRKVARLAREAARWESKLRRAAQRRAATGAQTPAVAVEVGQTPPDAISKEAAAILADRMATKPSLLWLKTYLDGNLNATLRDIETAAKKAGHCLPKSSINDILKREKWIGHPPRGKRGKTSSVDPGVMGESLSEENTRRKF